MDIPLFIYNLLEEDHRRNAVRRERRIIRDHINPFEMPNDQFIKLFRLNKDLILRLIHTLEPHVEPTVRITGIHFSLKVLATMHFLGSGSFQTAVGASTWSCMSQPMVSKSVKLVTRLIANHLMEEWIKFPTSNEDKLITSRNFFVKWQMRGVLGAIDGTHVEIIAPPKADVDHPPFVYINRKGRHIINVMLICDANNVITAVDARYPGSTHDSAIFRVSNIRQYLQLEYEAGRRNSYLVGDSGYGIEPWLLTPFSRCEPNSPQERFNSLLRTTRNVIERTNGILKKRFACLSRHRVLQYHPADAAYIIYASCVCHNMARQANIPIDDEDEEIDNNEINEVEEIYLGNAGNLGRAARDQYIRDNNV